MSAFMKEALLHLAARRDAFLIRASEQLAFCKFAPCNLSSTSTAPRKLARAKLPLGNAPKLKSLLARSAPPKFARLECTRVITRFANLARAKLRGIHGGNQNICPMLTTLRSSQAGSP